MLRCGSLSSHCCCCGLFVTLSPNITNKGAGILCVHNLRPLLHNYLYINIDLFIGFVYIG